MTSFLVLLIFSGCLTVSSSGSPKDDLSAEFEKLSLTTELPTSGAASSSVGEEIEIPFGDEELAGIENYLSELDVPPGFAPESMLHHFEGVINLVDSIGPELLITMDAEEVDCPFCGLDGEKVKACAKALIGTVHSCEPEVIQLLRRVRDLELDEGNLLSGYARGALIRCFQAKAPRAADMIIRALSKVDSSLFRFMDKIAKKVRKSLEQSVAALSPKQLGDIKITDDSDSDNDSNTDDSGERSSSKRSDLTMNLRPFTLSQGQPFDTAFAILKLFDQKLSNEGQEVEMGSTDNLLQLRQFYAENLVDPCESALEKVGPIVREEFEDDNNPEILDILINAITERAQLDAEAGVQREILRICLELRRMRDVVWDEIQKLWISRNLVKNIN